MEINELDARDTCVASGINIATFTKTLLNSSIFSKCARRLYCLTGADIPPGLVEELSEKQTPSKVLKSCGWTGHQKPWVVYELSEGLIRSGVATIPSSLRAFIVGEFALKDENSSHFGTLVARNGQAWGLGPFFRRRGGDPGHFLSVKFDLASHEVHLLMGDESVVYPEDDMIVTPLVRQEAANNLGNDDPQIATANTK